MTGAHGKLVSALALLATLLSAGRLGAALDRWSPIGPYGGGVNALAAAPGVAGLVYAGTDTAGVWKSRDGGESWHPARVGLPAGASIRRLAIGGRSGQTVYAASRFAFYASEDGGRRWTRRSVPPAILPEGLADSGFLALAASESAPRTVYLSYRGGATGSGGGLLRSTDGGGSWQALDDAIPPGLPPIFPAIVVAPTLQATADTVYLAAGRGRILRSTDGGLRWQLGATLPGEPYGVELAVDPRAAATLYAGWDDQVARSTDGGASWSEPVAVAPPGEELRLVADLAISPSGAIYFALNRYVGGNEWYDGGSSKFEGQLFRSADQGASWARLAATDAAAALAVDRAAPDRLYAGVSRIGILRSVDGGDSWRKSNHGLKAAAVCTVAPDPRHRGLLYIAAGICAPTFDLLGGNQDLGFLKGGPDLPWVPANRGVRVAKRVLEPHGVVPDPRTPATLYAATGQGLFKSANGGGQFTPVRGGLESILEAVLAVGVDPEDPSRLYAVGYKLGTPVCGGFCPVAPIFAAARSNDAGASWHRLSFGPDALGYAAHGLEGFEWVFDPAGSRVLYLVRSQGTLQKSEDWGTSWGPVPLHLGSETFFARHLAIDPTTPSTLYAVAQGQSSPSTVIKSTDGGHAWRRTVRGLPQAAAVRDLAHDPRRPATLYAATSQGIFVSENGGGEWAALAGGLAGLDVLAVRPDSVDPATLYAATAGGGGLFALTRSGR